jgi:tetratricopeptide (TPR) repeat protein
MDLADGLRLERKGQFKQAVRAYKAMLDEATQLAERGQLLLRIGSAYWEDSDPDTAEDRLAEALAIADELDDAPLRGEVLRVQGTMACEQGKYKIALSRLAEAAALLSSADSPRVDVEIQLAAAERARGELSSALERLRALEPYVSTTALRAEYLDELGAVHLERGEFDDAQKTLEEALEIDDRTRTDFLAARSELLLARAVMAQGDRSRALRLIKDAHDAYETIERGQSEALIVWGEFHEEGGDYNSAARRYRQAYELDRGSDLLGAARGLRRLARIARRKGDASRAAEYLDDARALLTGSEDNVERAAIQTEEGLLALSRQDFDRAVERFSSALRLAQDDGDERMIAVAKRHLAKAYREDGDPVEAHKLLSEARIVLHERGDKRELDELLDDLGEVLLDLDRYPEALEALNLSRELDELLGAASSLARTEMLRGKVYLKLGDRQRAGVALKQAEQGYADSEDEVGHSDALVALAEWCVDEGRLRDAIRHFRDALAIDSRHDDSAGRVRAYRGLAGAYRRLGNFGRAAEQLEDAATVLEGKDDPEEVARLALEQGQLALALGDDREAEDRFRSAMRGFEMIASTVEAATARRMLARVMSFRADWDEALELLRGAEGVFRQFDDVPELDELYDDLGLVYLRMGRLDEARAAVNQSLGLGREKGWASGSGRSQMLLGEIELGAGRPADARMYFHGALKSYEDDDVGRSEAYISLGDAYLAEHRDDDAIAAYKEARRIDLSNGDSRGLVRVFRKLGAMYFRRGEYERAEESYEQAEEYAARTGESRERGPLDFAWGELLSARGEYPTAIRRFQSALAQFKRTRRTEWVAATYQRLAGCYQTTGRIDDALALMHEMGLQQAQLWRSLLSYLHPIVVDAAQTRYLDGDYRGAIIESYRRIERELATRLAASVGRADAIPDMVSDRIREWVRADARGVAPFRDVRQLENYRDFSVAAFDLFRNRAMHGETPPDAIEAFAGLAVAHVVLAYLDAPTDPAGSRPLDGATPSESGSVLV